MSDHFSGPRAIAGPAGDICDLYAFPSPERSGHLVLVLNVLPKATSDSHFSEAIVYRFRLRPVTIAGVGDLSMREFDQVNRDLEVRDLHNLDFHMSKDYGGAYRARLPRTSHSSIAWTARLTGRSGLTEPTL